MSNSTTGSDSFAGRTALVTGAGRGIGRALALGLAAAGASVIAVARSSHDLREMAQAATGPTPHTVTADLADRGQLSTTIEEVRRLGHIDILVNNAASVEPLGPSRDVAAAAFARALDLNVLAPVALALALLPAMLDAGWGRVVNISSGAAGSPTSMVGANAYVTSKFALEAHTLNLAAEVPGTGVTVNAYRPGLVDTSMQGFIRDQDPARIGAGLHDRFTRYREQDALITPEASAGSLIERLPGPDNGQVWNADDSL